MRFLERVQPRWKMVVCHSLVVGGVVLLAGCSIFERSSDSKIVIPAYCGGGADGNNWVAFHGVFSGKAGGKPYSDFFSISCESKNGCQGIQGDVSGNVLKKTDRIDGVRVQSTGQGIFTFQWGSWRTFLLDFNKRQIRLVQNVDKDNNLMDVTLSCAN